MLRVGQLSRAAMISTVCLAFAPQPKEVTEALERQKQQQLQQEQQIKKQLEEAGVVPLNKSTEDFVVRPGSLGLWDTLGRLDLLVLALWAQCDTAAMAATADRLRQRVTKYSGLYLAALKANFSKLARVLRDRLPGTAKDFYGALSGKVAKLAAAAQASLYSALGLDDEPKPRRRR